MARQIFSTVTSPPAGVEHLPSTVTPSSDSASPHSGATLRQRPSRDGLVNFEIDSERHTKNFLLDPYTAQVATEVYAFIVGAWKLDDSDAERLLPVDHQTWMRIKNGEWSGLLDREQLMRISAIIGLHKALHSCFGEGLANQWVKRPNTGPIFSGRKPIEVMIEGGLQVIIEARDYMGAFLLDIG